MPAISIIIVNYNVRYFLDQCLKSIFNNAGGFDLQVIVVDNNSTDDSVSMLEQQFPQVTLIQSTENLGFSKGNNQGLRHATGKYILFLNPDTILGSDTLRICYNHLEQHPDTGAVCVRMIDGAGNYLPESKRGNPTFSASFYKMTGLYKLFPRNKLINQYYKGNIGEFESAHIDVMTGAFIFMPARVLEITGSWDEDFFMYGEDIDLSYRIRQAGYNITYLPQTSIIHFKGESTRRASYNYIRTFYSAMNIFVRKHYKDQGNFYVMLLDSAVYFRTALAMVSSIFTRALPVLLDLVLIYTCLTWLRKAWGSFYFQNPEYIGEGFLKVNAPVYTIIWVIAALLCGKYFSKTTLTSIFKATIYGTIAILIIYALFNSDYRNSRTVILAGAVGAFLIFTLTAAIRNLLTSGKFRIRNAEKVNYLVVGDTHTADKVKPLMEQPGKEWHYAGQIPADGAENALGSIRDLSTIIEAYQLNEIIFSQKDVDSDQMMELMSRHGKDVRFRIVPEDALSILSSNSKNKKGELFTIPLQYQLNEEKYRFQKRVFDLLCGVGLLILCPVLIFFFDNRSAFIKNIIDLLTGNITLVSYASHPHNYRLPELAPGVLSCSTQPAATAEEQWFENMNYARYYYLGMDWDILIHKFKQLDERTRR